MNEKLTTILIYAGFFGAIIYGFCSVATKTPNPAKWHSNFLEDKMSFEMRIKRKEDLTNKVYKLADKNSNDILSYEEQIELAKAAGILPKDKIVIENTDSWEVLLALRDIKRESLTISQLEKALGYYSK